MSEGDQPGGIERRLADVERRLAEIERRWLDIPKGPWSWLKFEHRGWTILYDGQRQPLARFLKPHGTESVIAAIAHAVDDVAWLITELRRIHALGRTEGKSEGQQEERRMPERGAASEE